MTIAENFRRLNPGVTDNDCRAALARFQFRADAADRQVGTLSGGQLLRAGLAWVLGGPKPPPLLMLDEPTSHLDIDSAPRSRTGCGHSTGRLWRSIIDPLQLGGLLCAIDNYRGYPSTIAALRISAHLFQRPGEIRTMRWEDVDLEKARWSIPGGSTKMRRAHEVPLSRQVLTVIRSLADVSHSDFVFPAYHNWKQPISENAVNQALRRMGYKDVMTAHGFRSTASSLLNESGQWSPDVIEQARAHKDSNAIRAIYNRTTYWNGRVAMMQWWSDKLDELKLSASSGANPKLAA